MARLRHLSGRKHFHKWLLTIRFVQQRMNLRVRLRLRERGRDGGQHSAMDRDQVRHKGDCHLFTRRQRQFLFDFAQMPVFRHAVGVHVIGYFSEEEPQFQLAAGAGNAGQRRDHDAASLNPARAQKRREREDDAGGEAARRRDQLR